MYLTAIKPNAEVTSLDLAHPLVWKLALEVAQTPGDEQKAALTLGIRYLTGGLKDGSSFVQIITIPCKCSPMDLAPVIRIGFPQERVEAKERLKESLKVLYNAAVSPKDVDEILVKSGTLVDAYFDICEVLFQITERPFAMGELDGYSWVVTKTRFNYRQPPPVVEEEPETIVVETAPAESKAKKRKIKESKPEAEGDV